MRTLGTIAVAAALAALVAPAAAQEAADDPLALLATFDAEADAAYLVYAYAACPWECAVAVFTCDARRQTSIQFGAEHADVTRWFQVASNDQPYPAIAELRADGAATEFILYGLDFSELDGLWWGELVTFAFLTEWMPPFAAATDIAIVTPAFEIALTPAEGDPVERARFVDACLVLWDAVGP